MQTCLPWLVVDLSYAPPYAARLGPDLKPLPAPASFAPTIPVPLLHTTLDGRSLQHELASPALLHLAVQAVSGLSNSSLCMADTLPYNDGAEQWAAHKQGGSSKAWAPTRTLQGLPAQVLWQVTSNWVGSPAFKNDPPLVITSAGKKTSSLQMAALIKAAAWHLDVTPAVQAALQHLWPADGNTPSHLLFGLSDTKALLLGFPGVKTPVLWIPHTHPCQVATFTGRSIIPGDTLQAFVFVLAMFLEKVVRPDPSVIQYTSPGMSSRGGESSDTEATRLAHAV